MTLDRYGHLVRDGIEDVADRMEAARADFLRTKRADRRPFPDRQERLTPR